MATSHADRRRQHRCAPDDHGCGPGPSAPRNQCATTAHGRHRRRGTCARSRGGGRRGGRGAREDRARRCARRTPTITSRRTSVSWPCTSCSTPEDERELSQGIEDTEILTWERVFARADVVRPLLALIEPNLEQPVKFPKLQKVLDELLKSKRAQKDAKLAKKLAAAAKEAAAQLRAARSRSRSHRCGGARALSGARGRASQARRRGGPMAPGATPQRTSTRCARRIAMPRTLRDEFVRANLRLVVTMARRYDRGGMPLADLIQEGNLGLMHAVSRFDYRRGLRFSTYACWWIRHAIGRALADKARAVRIPVHMLEAQQQLEKVRQSLVGELGRPPTPQELAKAARVPLAKLNQMHRYIMGQPMSLDRPVHDDDDRSFGDTMADPDSEEHSPADNMTTQTLTGPGQAAPAPPVADRGRRADASASGSATTRSARSARSVTSITCRASASGRSRTRRSTS